METGHPSTRVVETGLKAFSGVCECMCESVCLSVRTYVTKTAETNIAKLGTGIVHHDTSPAN